MAHVACVPVEEPIERGTEGTNDIEHTKEGDKGDDETQDRDT